MSNSLKQEKSPYLLQHKDQPVAWYPWCQEAFEKAAGEDKPIFLSIGYSTCHWCHVMARESFDDSEVADLLNKNFVSIKVDREERPDIDAVYMSVCQVMTGSGGWPLTILMAPDQKPFYAGTYFPKRSRYGQIGLIELLTSVAQLWTTDRQKLQDTGNQLTALLQQSKSTSSSVPRKPLFHTAYAALSQSFDPQYGGFGAAPKFPTPHTLMFLMQYARWEEKPEAQHMAQTTLDAMARGGIHDQIGGGFSRYSTDAKWLVPHFEKMLYDNALLILTYLEAYQTSKSPTYAEVVCKTADYILRELTDNNGGFYCGQDADSDGVEGKYYVFTPDEIVHVLGRPDGMEFCRLYNITESGNFEGKSIPNRICQSEMGWNATDPRLKALQNFRKARTPLHTDDKILLSWNAWTVIALSRAGQILEKPAYLNAAIKAQKFIQRHMTDNRDRLYHRFRDAEAAHDGQLEDYAVYALCLLELYQHTFLPEYLKQAIHRATQMLTLFEDPEHGGYFINASDAEHLILRPKETYDGAIPSGNSVAAMVLGRLAGLTGTPFWQEAAARQYAFLAGQIMDYPAGHCFSLLAMGQTLYPHRELICASNSIPPELTAYLKENPTNNLNILLKTEENAALLSECAPFTEAYPVSKHHTIWYLCENGTCKAPVTDFSQLRL